MILNKQEGFTLIELIVVIGLAAMLLIVALSGFNSSKQRARDDIRISDIQKIRIALEQYRSSCGVYPNQLSAEANNARVGTCDKKLKDFLGVIPTPPGTSSSGSDDNEGPRYLYSALSTSLGGPCYEYHIGAVLENKKSNELKEDHDYSVLALNAPFRYKCQGAEDPISNADNDDVYGIYDFRSSLSQ